MVVIADCFLLDSEVVEQFLRLSRILASDKRCFVAQNTQCPERDVLQVPDGSGNQIQRARQSSSVSLKPRGFASKIRTNL